MYVLNGFQEAGSIPVNFPIDICLFKIEDYVYAAALHKKSSKGNDTILSIFDRVSILTVFPLKPTKESVTLNSTTENSSKYLNTTQKTPITWIALHLPSLVLLQSQITLTRLKILCMRWKEVLPFFGSRKTKILK